MRSPRSTVLVSRIDALSSTAVTLSGIPVVTETSVDTLASTAVNLSGTSKVLSLRVS